MEETMEWVGLIFVAACAFVLGRGTAAQKKTEGPAPTRSGLSSASDRDLMLSTFRRELANYLVRLDPDRFLRLCDKAHRAEAQIKAADKAERDAQFVLITKRYPHYEDFDLIGTRSHVLYADALNSHSVEDIEEHFLNLVKFHAVQRANDTDWKFRGPAISDKDIEHLQGYVRKIKDTRFLQRLKNAVTDFYAHRQPSGFESAQHQVLYETKNLSVFRIPHIVEIRHGFHFKDTDEFGLYSVFYADGRDKPYESYYRSDRMFEAENHLDNLRIDETI
jgi:hypothetical protein